MNHEHFKVFGYLMVKHLSRRVCSILNFDGPNPYSNLLQHMRYLQTSFVCMMLHSLEVRLSFLIKIVASKAGEMENPFLIQDNAKFSISFVRKYPLCFSPQNDTFIYCIAEIFKKL